MEWQHKRRVEQIQPRIKRSDFRQHFREKGIGRGKLHREGLAVNNVER